MRAMMRITPLGGDPDRPGWIVFDEIALILPHSTGESGSKIYLTGSSVPLLVEESVTALRHSMGFVE